MPLFFFLSEDFIDAYQAVRPSRGLDESDEVIRTLLHGTVTLSVPLMDINVFNFSVSCLTWLE